MPAPYRHDPGKQTLVFSAGRGIIQLENRSTSGTSVDSMRTPEERMQQHERSIIQLKRTRNSLLNVSRLPPEILGEIFNQSLIPDGFEKRSLKFLLVCYYWSQVALGTPDIWSFWGDSLREWEERHLRYPEFPLDLVLSEFRFAGESPDIFLRKSLRERASRDTIRVVHLRSTDWKLLSIVLFPLTPNRKEIRYTSVESIILRNLNDKPVHASRFLAYNRFPKLQRLEITNCTIVSWDLLASHTTALTTLTLHLSHLSPIPTTFQPVSILTSNPILKKLTLTGCSVPNDGDKSCSLRASLSHLKELKLAGRPHNVIKFLHRLDVPKRMDNLDVTLNHSTIEDISDSVGPYLRDYLRHRGRPEHGLGIYISSDGCVALHVGDTGGLDPSTLVSKRVVPFIAITVNAPSGDLPERIILSLIAHTPREEIVYLQTRGNPTAMENIYSQFPNLRALHSERVPLSAMFPKPTPNGDSRVPPLLRHIFFERLVADGGDWTPLTTFVSRRACSEKWLDSLEIISSSRMRREVVENIGTMVWDFRTDR